MPTPHPHHALAKRLMPIAAHIRENDVDGHLAEAAVRVLAETLGLDIVVVDPDPEQRLEDLGREFLDVLGQLAEAPDAEARAVVSDAAYSMALGAMKVLREMYKRMAGERRSLSGR
jgi:hypothetical protein